MELETRRVTVGPIAENCWLVWRPERDDCAVIDPGDEPERIRAAAGGRRIAAILLTHGHWDHIGAADALRGPDAPVWVHEADAAMLSDPELNACWMLGVHITAARPDFTAREGDVIEAAGIPFTVLHTPGHTAGSACFRAGDVLFTGDTLMNGGGWGRTDLPTGSEAAMRQSLRRLVPLVRDEGLTVCGGHGA